TFTLGLSSLSCFCFSSFFFSQLSRHPTPTLFPYTTLFRSLDEVCDLIEHLHRRDERAHLGILAAQQLGEVDQRGRAAEQIRNTGDRKSTRLNSSHDQNSYAVFCLKKKTRHLLRGARASQTH